MSIYTFIKCDKSYQNVVEVNNILLSVNIFVILFSLKAHSFFNYKIKNEKRSAIQNISG